jgi:uncharacterized protein (DUF2062 family)
LKALLKRIVTKIMRQANRMAVTEGVIARSMAMGMAVGFSPTIGLQVVICLAITLSVNRILQKYTFDTVIALIGSLVVNPFTMLPTYTAYYFIGCQMMTCSRVVEFESDHQIHRVLTNLGEGTLAILLGSSPFMLLGLPLGYWIGRLIERFLARRIAKRHARLVERRQQRQSVVRDPVTETS